MSFLGSHTQTIESDRRDANKWAISLPQRSLRLFDDARAIAFVTTKADAPDLLNEVGQQRIFCFGRDAATTSESYALDEYDEYYRHLIVVDKLRGSIVAGLRLGLGGEIITAYGHEALYTATYWTFGEAMIEIARQGVEIGRTWVHPEYQKRIWGLSSLWKALALFLDSTRCKFLFGAVSFVGYPQEAREMIMNYLWRYHQATTHLVNARQSAVLKNFDHYAVEQQGLSAKQALHRLASALDRIDSQWPVPVLLRHYIKLGAVLAGEFAWNNQANKMLALILLPTEQTQAAVKRFRSL